MHKTKNNNTYEFFLELFKRYTPEELDEWGRKNMPGLKELIKDLSTLEEGNDAKIL